MVNPDTGIPEVCRQNLLVVLKSIPKLVWVVVELILRVPTKNHKSDARPRPTTGAYPRDDDADGSCVLQVPRVRGPDERVPAEGRVGVQDLLHQPHVDRHAAGEDRCIKRAL